MSVLSDITITTLCTPPTHVYGEHLIGNPPFLWAGLTHTHETILEKLLAKQIRETTEEEQSKFKQMIAPFSASSIKVDQAGQKIASFGVSSYGYDLRAAPEYKLYAPPKPSLLKRIKAFFTGESPYPAVDYKNITDDMFQTVTGDKIIIPPHGFILTRSVERVCIPRGVLALCIGKSTIARVGINCLCTPIEPEWEGYITFEFHNTLDQPNTFYANEGVLQLIFLGGDQACATSYGDRGGKYQGQGEQIILPRV